MLIRKIISGGQTGADQGGLVAGRLLGIETGGTAPKGFLTETGEEPRLAQLGLVEHPSRGYSPRTRSNVEDSDGTLIFGNTKSAGSHLTALLCQELNRPVFEQPWKSGGPDPDPKSFLCWLDQNNIRVLNVAGNRESVNRGIGRAVVRFLQNSLTSSVEGETDVAHL